MQIERVSKRIAKPTDTGQITVPPEHWQRLGINDNTWALGALRDSRIEISPIMINELESPPISKIMSHRDYRE